VSKSVSLGASSNFNRSQIRGEFNLPKRPPAFLVFSGPTCSGHPIVDQFDRHQFEGERLFDKRLERLAHRLGGEGALVVGTLRTSGLIKGYQGRLAIDARQVPPSVCTSRVVFRS
jgi:hypothetical protein